MDAFDACTCGDYRHQHTLWRGACDVCAGSSAPWDTCQEFSFSKADEPPTQMPPGYADRIRAQRP